MASGSQVRVLKVTAAQRQLNAAIRMSFAGEDTLAITTVAAASYQLLHDLLVKRGRRVLADEWRTDIVGTARALVRGELPLEHLEAFKADQETWRLLSSVADIIRKAGPEKTITELAELVGVELSQEAEASHWRQFRRIPNFLKHADRDHEQSVSADEVDAEHLILRACGLYLDLMGRLTAEMDVWSTHYFYVANDIGEPHDDLHRSMVRALKAAGPERLGAAALELVAVLKAT